MKKLLVVLLLGGVVLGCAKFPGGGGGTGATRLIFRLVLDGPINPNFVYIVAMRPTVDDPPTSPGPVPVVAPPWGNGFVEGGVTHFVRWDVAQSPHYILYQFQDDQLINYTERGVPISFLEVEANGNELMFTLELPQISASKAEAETWRTLQVNFLTMDVVPQGTGGNKSWDALGDGRLPSEINEYVNIPLRTSGVYDNRRFQDLEPTGDNPDPALDIRDWSVEVRL